MSNIIKSLRRWLQQGNRLTWAVFCLFTLLLFVKQLIFHWDAFHSLLVSSLWRNPIAFYKFYMAKLLMPLFIASFVFISRHRWWTVLVSFLTDIWCMANLIYYKTYDSFLSVNDILLVGNLNGAWDSVTAYFDICMVLLLLLSIVWSIIYFLIPKTQPKRQWGVFGLSILVIYGLAMLNNYLIYNPRFWADNSSKAEQKAQTGEDWDSFVNTHGGFVRTSDGDMVGCIPFFNVYYREATRNAPIISQYMVPYTCVQSVLADFIAINIDYLYQLQNSQKISLTDEDKRVIGQYIYQDSIVTTPANNLIIILVESLEDWPLHHEIEGQQVAPYLMQLKEQNHVLYCEKIKSQALGGNSGDGQMIINTGLLPIRNGVACMHYGNNVYPNIAHFYTKSALINPFPRVWNQDTMTVRYSYCQKIEPTDGFWEDKQVVEHSLHCLQDNEPPMCLLTITLSTHSPFNRVKNNKVQTTAPAILNRYMQCLNYTDSCIGAFMEAVLHDPILSQSTIVITGDHTIFKPAMLTEFHDYAVEQNLPIASGDNYCPLIIYSPEINGNIHITDECYQMDIFPTILHLIGCENYYWHGLGVNLLDAEARHHRTFSEQEAYRLSDMLIRSDYFHQYYGMK